MVTDAQILRFLNEGQRKLCLEGGILVSCWTTSTVASQEEYSIPADFTRVRSVFLYQTNGSQIKLTPIRMEQRDPSQSLGTPVFYYVWGLNVSSANQPTICLNPIPSTSGTSDLRIFGHQVPLDMVSGGQAPEVMWQWQDALSTYGVWRCLQRRGLKYESMARDAQAEWEDWVNQARRFHNPMGLDQPTTMVDTGGYTVAEVS
jgi:hypothetical protein